MVPADCGFIGPSTTGLASAHPCDGAERLDGRPLEDEGDPVSGSATPRDGVTALWCQGAPFVRSARRQDRSATPAPMRERAGPRHQLEELRTLAVGILALSLARPVVHVDQGDASLVG